MKAFKRIFWLAVVGATASLATPSPAVGTREFILDGGNDFKGGDLEGVAVDSVGRVRAGINLREIPVDQVAAIWTAFRRSDGSVLLGTGNEGKLLRLRGERVDQVSDTDALVVTAFAEAWNELVVGTMPGGKIHRLAGGRLTPLVELEGVQHVWNLAFDETRKVLYAATGPEGKLWRITRDGTAQLYFDAREKHLVSLAIAADGTVFAGSSDDARLYAVQGPGRASVVYDFGKTEVRSIAVARGGALFVIANEIATGSLSSKAKAKDSGQEGGASNSEKTKGKGSLYHFTSDGTPTVLMEDGDDHYVSLALDEKGNPYVGTGSEGRLYMVDDNHNSVLVADLEQRQVSALLLSGGQHYVAVSDPAAIYAATGTGGAEAVWTSKVLDAGIRARFGRLRWTSSGALEFSTRTGNSDEPDETWSDWSNPMTAAAPVESPPGRFVQIRARWNRDPSAVLDEVTLPFVTDNLRAIVTTIGTGRSSNTGSSGVDASGGPIGEKSDSTVRLTWKVDNPDEDTLRYRLEYQLLGSPYWYPLLKPEEVLTDDDYKWDTSTMPEGWYRVRVSASDELSNPPTRATAHSLESGLMLIDNTPPIVRNLGSTGTRVTGVAVDGASPIKRIELSLAGTDLWYPFEPEDGIFDQGTERFVADVTFLVLGAPALVAVRVYDAANNFVVRHVTVRP